MAKCTVTRKSNGQPVTSLVIGGRGVRDAEQLDNKKGEYDLRQHEIEHLRKQGLNVVITDAKAARAERLGKPAAKAPATPPPADTPAAESEEVKLTTAEKKKALASAKEAKGSKLTKDEEAAALEGALEAKKAAAGAEG